MYGEAISGPREWLHVAIDDFCRFLVADILPDKTSYSSAIFLEETLHALPFRMEKAFSDNGSEYKGRPDHPFVAGLRRHGISQSFTKPRHPYTNGKAERVIKTIMTECFGKSGRTFQSREHRHKFLYAFRVKEKSVCFFQENVHFGFSLVKWERMIETSIFFCEI
ncbi:MAG: transposase family protein [Patescibacteria group bacterium]|nr:transposase family protein [Patescibacteria group bacterium]